MLLNKKSLLICLLALNVSAQVLGNEKIENKDISATKIEKVQVPKEVYESIRIKWFKYLTGVDYINLMTEEERVAHISSLENTAEIFMNSMQYDTPYIFDDLKNIKDGVPINNVYNRLRTVATVYNIPQSKYYKNEKLKEAILFTMEHIGKNYYYIGAPERGNWWQWELGIPKAINDVITLMYDEIPVEKRMEYLKTSQYFQPYAEYSGSSPSADFSSNPGKRLSTGGNRLDTSIISFIRGVLMEDPVQTFDGANGVIDTGVYVTSGDGFYEDGSFVQHGNIAYNGTYASVLFGGLGQILYLASGTPFEVTAKEVNNIYDVVLNGYSYLFINGGIADLVSGRSISRDNTSEMTRGREVMANLALISEGAPQEYKIKLKSLIKNIIEENNSEIQPEGVRNLTLRNTMIDIKENKDIVSTKTTGVKLFPAMDRAIYKTEKDGKFGIAMHSSRIGNYETMNGENIKGWHTSDGVTYIYGIDSSSTINYWPTVDMYHLPGITESLKPRLDKSGERRFAIKMAPNSWTGGVSNNEIGLVGMDFYSWNNATKAKKTWIFVDNMMIALGSNINSSDGEVHTTIDNRIIKDDLSNKVYVGGHKLDKNVKLEYKKDLHIELEGNLEGENFVYKLLEPANLVISKTTRKGNWKDLGGKSTEEISKNYFTTYIDHGKNPKDAKYMYAVMPMFTMEEAKNYDWDSIKVMELSDKVHHIQKDDYTIINFWKDQPTKVDKYKAFSTLSLIAKDKKEILELWVSDPTQLSEKSILEVDGKYSLVESSSENTEVKVKGDKTQVILRTDNNGQTISLKLKKI